MTRLQDALATVVKSYRVSGPLWTASVVLHRIGFDAIRFWPETRVSVELLRDQIVSILRGFGMTEEHVAVTTEHILYSDVHGIDSHGCGMLHTYYEDLIAGRVTMNPKIEVIRESPTTALIDGGGGLGHVPSDMAMKLAVKKCHESGIAAIAVRNSGHYGAAGAYARIAAQEGFIGISMTNTSEPSVVPTFGRDPMFGTNPIAFAAPAGKNPPFHLDMSTSTVPLGKIMMALRKGRPIEEGWAVDADGLPVTNARAALKQNRLTPLGSTSKLGSYKGYGLATVVEILTSVLAGSAPNRNKRTVDQDVCHFFLVLNPASFRAPGEFESELNTLMDSLRSSRPLEAKQPVMVAGDPEQAAFAERIRSGIPLTRALIEEIRTICHATGLPFLLHPQKSAGK